MNYIEECCHIIGNHKLSLSEEDVLNFIQIRRRWSVGTLSVINHATNNTNYLYENDGFLNYPKVKRMYDLGFTLQIPHILDLNSDLRELNEKLFDVRGCDTIGNFYFSRGTADIPSFPPHKHNYNAVVKSLYGSAEWVVGDDKFVTEPGDIVLIPSQCMHAVICGENPRLSITFNLDE